jgi:hypothetical protein
MRTDRQMVMWAATVHCIAVTTTAMALRRGRHADITIASPLPLVWCLSVLGLQRQAPHLLCDARLSVEGGRTCCWGVSHEFAFICNGANGSHQEVGIQPHLSKSSAECGRYLSATKKESINARGGRRRGSHMLEIVSVVVDRKIQQLLSLLLLQHAHLLFEHLAMRCKAHCLSCLRCLSSMCCRR